MLRFVRRDLIANYQQTILGPIWIFLQPLLTTFVYYLVFGKIAKVKTDGISPLLFYLPGVIIWTFFSECLNGTMYTFLSNTHIFNKVYFPRLIVPLSIVVSQSVRFGIQLLLFFAVFVFHLFAYHDVNPSILPMLLLLPLLVCVTAAFGLGSGLLISVFTARYRDLDYALQFLLRLFMYAAPIVYPVSMVPEKYRFLCWLNPLTPVIETFRSVFFTGKPVEVQYLLISVASVSLLLLAGMVLFKKREVQVMDII
ncbi:MAG: ABC transporter permease [Puia sp.]|nr:ABC transporter permease [Puia sp.]